MAAITKSFGILFRDRPFVWPMAVKALQILLDHMKTMLTDIDFVGVAGPQAFGTLNLQLLVGMMAFVTFDLAHDAFLRDIRMAFEAPLGRCHFML
jgi:hypothetical protein